MTPPPAMRGSQPLMSPSESTIFAVTPPAIMVAPARLPDAQPIPPITAYMTTLMDPNTSNWVKTTVGLRNPVRIPPIAPIAAARPKA